MKVIDKINQTRGLADNYIIKSKAVEKLVKEVDCLEHTTDGKQHVFYTTHTHKVQGQIIPTTFRAAKTKNGKWWITK